MRARLGTWLALVALIGSPIGCSGSATDESGPATETTAAAAAISADMLARTWPVRFADDAARAPFEGVEGWAGMFTGDSGAALRAFQSTGGRGLARAHTEHAALYRHAARLAVASTLHLYGEGLRRDTDPVEVDYLLGVAHALQGETDAAKAAFARLPKPADDALLAGAQAWTAWLDAGAAWPPDQALAAHPLWIAAPTAETMGTLPQVDDPVSFSWAENTDDARQVDVGDPTTLYALSRWHEAAARLASPDDDAVITAIIGLNALDGEPAVDAAPEALTAPVVDDAWLFAGSFLAAEDIGFLLQARAEGVPAVASWADRSPLAATVAPAIVEGKVDTEKLLDQAAELAQQSAAAMAITAGGKKDFHAAFSQLARVAALRAGMVVADGSGEARDAGVLRINALERYESIALSTAAGTDSTFEMSVAAWAGETRNPLRAQDSVLSLSRRFPALEIARHPLLALQVRLGRMQVNDGPKH